jgi:hypothetical protein
VQISATPTRETRIPEHPNQTPFLQNWYSFYLGFSLQNGKALIKGEPWREVEPGHLPRTEEEIRLGYFTSQLETSLHDTEIANPATTEQPPHESIEDILDSLMAQNGAGEMVLPHRPLRRGQENTPPPDRISAGTAAQHTQDVDTIYWSNNTSWSSIHPEPQHPHHHHSSMSPARVPTHSRVPRPHTGYGNASTANESSHEAQRTLARNLAQQVGEEQFRQSERAGQIQQQRPLQEYDLNVVPWTLTPGRGRAVGLDASSRPGPATEEEMTVKLECAICYEHRSDIVCLPCGHTVMCQWCAEMHMPLRNAMGLVAFDAKCPTCRERVNSRVRIYFGQ